MKTLFTRISLLFVLAPISLATDIRPNILFCISDDQSYAHTGANGDRIVQTPAFDRIAREGIRFTHAFCDAPTCGPSRSAILTGQHIWRLEEAGNIHSTLPAKFATYTELLGDSGYQTAFTGKGWSPGRLEPGGRTENPAGTEYRRVQLKNGRPGMANLDYAGNFQQFLSERDANRPFCFWLGTFEPHRGYREGIGLRDDRNPDDVVVPASLPDHSVIREDILDYYVEVEHFDSMVARAIEQLEKRGLLENTIVVVTSDHGMPFPRAKATLYDDGTHVPLAIRWGSGLKSPGRISNALVNLSDLAPTFLQSAGLDVHPQMTGRSLLSQLKSATTEPKLNRAFVAMERHDGCRSGGKGFPCRGMRKRNFLYLHNFAPERWPAGDPDASVCARAIPFGEVDSAPSKTLLMEQKSNPDLRPFYDLAFSKRSEHELYDLKKDPGQIRNVAADPDYADILKEMQEELTEYLKQTNDPRALGNDAPWDYYPYYGLRRNKDWKVDPRPK